MSKVQFQQVIQVADDEALDGQFLPLAQAIHGDLQNVVGLGPSLTKVGEPFLQIVGRQQRVRCTNRTTRTVPGKCCSPPGHGLASVKNPISEQFHPVIEEEPSQSIAPDEQRPAPAKRCHKEPIHRNQRRHDLRAEHGYP